MFQWKWVISVYWSIWLLQSAKFKKKKSGGGVTSTFIIWLCLIQPSLSPSGTGPKHRDAISNLHHFLCQFYLQIRNWCDRSSARLGTYNSTDLNYAITDWVLKHTLCSTYAVVYGSHWMVALKSFASISLNCPFLSLCLYFSLLHSFDNASRVLSGVCHINQLLTG